MSQQRILITGAGGFIGTHLVQRILSHPKSRSGEWDILCLVREPARFNLEPRAGLTVVVGDMLNLRSAWPQIGNCDYVFHLAADASFSGGMAAYHNNVNGTKALLELLRQTTGLKRLIFTSSIGAIDRHSADDCMEPLNENSIPSPLTTYGQSKLACEQLIIDSDLPYTIIRPTWVYGPGMRKNSHIRVFVDWVLKRNPITRVDFPGKISAVYVDDLTESLLLAAEHSDAEREIFFVADGQPVAIGQIFAFIGEVIGRPAADQKIPSVIVQAARKWRSRLPLTAQNLFSDVLLADSKKIEVLGFAPKTTFQDGLLKTMRWHLSQSIKSQDTAALTLITGAASGIGKSLAQHLYVRGHNLVLVDKDADKLNFVGQMVDAQALVLDLSNLQALDMLRLFFDENGRNFCMVVNNAGLGIRGLASKLSVDQQRKIIEVNCAALTAISHWALEKFEQNGQGILVNIASSAAFQSLPYMSVYAASKAYVLSFTRALIGEYLDTPNIRVFVISPSGTATDFQTTAGVRRDDTREKLLKPGHVAAQIIDCIQHDQREVTVGVSGMGMALLARILPASLQIRLWHKLMSKKR